MNIHFDLQPFILVQYRSYRYLHSNNSEYFIPSTSAKYQYPPEGRDRRSEVAQMRQCL